MWQLKPHYKNCENLKLVLNRASNEIAIINTKEEAVFYILPDRAQVKVDFKTFLNYAKVDCASSGYYVFLCVTEKTLYFLFFYDTYLYLVHHSNKENVIKIAIYKNKIKKVKNKKPKIKSTIYISIAQLIAKYQYGWYYIQIFDMV